MLKGLPVEGLHRVAEAIEAVQAMGGYFYQAELHRLWGALTRQAAVPGAAAAEGCYLQALEVAQRQQAKSLELWAAMSLARLWQQQGKRAEACELLAPIYGWFTEGWDTADLRDARALLADLAWEPLASPRDVPPSPHARNGGPLGSA